MNRFKIDHRADLAAIRAASVNAILDPWIYILLRRSLLRRLLSLSRRRSAARSISPPSPQRKLLCPDMGADGHVFTQLMCNANIITQLPATVKFNPCNSESLHQTLSSTDLAQHPYGTWTFAANIGALKVWRTDGDVCLGGFARDPQSNWVKGNIYWNQECWHYRVQKRTQSRSLKCNKKLRNLFFANEPAFF